MTASYAEYCKLPRPRIALRKGTVQHLYHGARKNRQYAERHKLLDVKRDIQDMIEINKDGVYEWTENNWNKVFFAYFRGRNDDDISENGVYPLTS
jgi:hypothetical protein